MTFFHPLLKVLIKTSLVKLKILATTYIHGQTYIHASADDMVV